MQTQRLDDPARPAGAELSPARARAWLIGLFVGWSVCVFLCGVLAARWTEAGGLLVALGWWP